MSAWALVFGVAVGSLCAYATLIFLAACTIHRRRSWLRTDTPAMAGHRPPDATFPDGIDWAGLDAELEANIRAQADVDEWMDR